VAAGVADPQTAGRAPVEGSDDARPAPYADAALVVVIWPDGRGEFTNAEGVSPETAIQWLHQVIDTIGATLLP
jgi:hypothetical protein